MLRLYQFAGPGDLAFPAINVNDSVTKSKFDNVYGTRHSLVDGINRGTDVLIGGKKISSAVTATSARAAPSRWPGRAHECRSPEIDPINALQALMDGFDVVTVEQAIGDADIVITPPATWDIITPDHMKQMKNQAIVGNIGHFDNEIDMAGWSPRGDSPQHQAAGRQSGSSSRATRSSCSARAGCSTWATPPAIRRS